MSWPKAGLLGKLELPIVLVALSRGCSSCRTAPVTTGSVMIADLFLLLASLGLTLTLPPHEMWSHARPVRFLRSGRSQKQDRTNIVCLKPEGVAKLYKYLVLVSFGTTDQTFLFPY